MERYVINKNLREAIIKSPHSLNKLSRLLNFNIKNVYYVNSSINEEHLKRIRKFFRTDFKLNKAKFNYAKNLGKYAFTKPIKRPRKNKYLAEFIGIMLGDGNIYKNSIKIAFDKRNESYIIHVNNLIKSLFGFVFKKQIYEKTNQAYLYSYNSHLVDYLIMSGLKRGNKLKNKLGIPKWIKDNKDYTQSCIRGLIDTDGCIYKCKREKQTYIKFTNFNYKLLNDFKSLSKSLGYSFAKANKNNFTLYRKDEVARFIKEIQPLKSVRGDVV